MTVDLREEVKAALYDGDEPACEDPDRAADAVLVVVAERLRLLPVSHNDLGTTAWVTATGAA